MVLARHDFAWFLHDIHGFASHTWFELEETNAVVSCVGGKTVALISLILEQYRGVFERIYIFSPSVNIDDGWIPVKKYIEEDLGRIIQQQRKITERPRSWN